MSIREALSYQAESNRHLGSPFTARVLDTLATQLEPGTPLTNRLFDWQGDIGPLGHSVPLRLLAGLHALVLSRKCPELVAVYPPFDAPDGKTLWQAIEVAMRDHATFLDHWLDSPPQTNEVRRASVMIAAGHWLAGQFNLPMKVFELGASAGLNLMWDQFALETGSARLGPQNAPVTLTPQWRGHQPSGKRPRVISRRGVDLMPLDVHDPEDALRMTSYLWADQPERLERSHAAMSIFDAQVDQGDAADWLETQLKHITDTHLTLVYHTIAWQYFPSDTQRRCAAAIKAASRNGPVAHLSMEADDQREVGAAINLALWPEGRKLALGRVDFHGRWVEWKTP